MLRFASRNRSLDNRLLAELLLPRTTSPLRTLEDFPIREVERRHAQFIASAEPRRPRPLRAPALGNLTLVSRVFELRPAEQAILQLVLAVHSSRELRDLFEAFRDTDLAKAAEFLATAANIEPQDARRALRPGSRLIDSGLLKVWPEATRSLDDKVEPTSGLVDAVATPGLDEQQLLGWFLTPAPASTLDWSDFEQMADEVRTARELLAAALATKRQGVNVLLWGVTGTGKTELAQLLAQDLGCPLYAAGNSDDDGESAGTNERLSSLLLGQRMLSKTRSLLIFDEIEDLFDWRPFTPMRDPAMSKKWFNLFLEQNPVPTIWTSNDVRGMDPAFLRRFLYAIEFQPLGIKQRTRILARHIGTNAAVSGEDIEAIATRFATSPGLFANAVSAAKLITPSGEPERAHIERTLEPITKLVDGEPPRRVHLELTRFRLDALHGSEDMTRIAERLEGWQHKRDPGISLCLYGPPGTGKSAYVHYLAQRMKLPIVHKRASDLLGPFLGQTEQAIAGAFREAERDGAVLLFDEADSFLRDRKHALRSWEVTQVNEFLQQLEHFDGVVACTTNLVGDLDEAAARRFTFNVELRYLRVEQAVDLFEHHLAELTCDWQSGSRELVRAELSRETNLTPGDFASVFRRARALEAASTVTQLVQALVDVARAKRSARRAVGFSTETAARASSARHAAS